MITKKPNKRTCDRCKELPKKIFYRYPHVWKNHEDMGYCSKAVWSKLLQFCETCVKIYDTNSDVMKLKDYKTQIKFHSQYGEKQDEKLS